MEDCDLTSDAIVPMYGRRTTIKYRIIGNNCHIVRVDDEKVQSLKEREKRQFLTTVEQIIDHNEIDAIIFEDYDKGLFSKDLISEIINFAHKKNIYVAVDPKEKNFNNYTNVNLFKPNLKEMSKGFHVEDNAELTLEEIHELAKEFAERQNIDKVMVTMSAKGIAFYDRQNDTFQHQPAFQRRVSDVSGAGDTVISVSTLFLLKGHSVEETCLAANLAGGIVCEYVGVVPINCAQLKAEMAKYAPGR
jgi:rfaE bifunctional protein kinase chain/domain